jgi:predicted DNA-binding transcriptional regulator AlpA
MNISELQKIDGANITVGVSLADLKEWTLSLLSESHSENKPKEDELISLEDAKKRPSISNSDATLYRWDKTGFLPKVKIGGRVFYRLSDIKKIEEG